ncbi:MAG: hypothetical protein JRG90_22170 [Deltaproteobacteria bacterium]|nr:hypothetical protein [Deltaproteobacteria bacterium]
MSDTGREPENSEESKDGVTTPFEKPFFMPVLLVLLAAWFGYDGWFNPEIESILFNRVVFGLLVLLAIYTTWQDVQLGKKSKD